MRRLSGLAPIVARANAIVQLGEFAQSLSEETAAGGPRQRPPAMPDV